MCGACDHAIRGRRHHFGWDNAPALAGRVTPGSTIPVRCQDALAGQRGPSSTVADVAALDFGRIGSASEPIWVEGAKPGDAVRVTLDGFALREREGTRWG